MRTSQTRRYSWLPALMIFMAVVALTIGGVTLLYIKDHLIARAGETLALAAADIADKLDQILMEHYRHIQVLAKAPVLRERDLRAASGYLDEVKKIYPVYRWIGVTNASGRIVAATEGQGVGSDWGRRPWFDAVRERVPVDVQDAQIFENCGEDLAVAFTAPITDMGGAFLGMVTACIGIRELQDVFAWTVRTFQLQRGVTGLLEWQFLTRDGDLIVDSLLHQEGKINLKHLALPSALFTGSAEPGYVEEEHLRRHVPVVTGYAQTEGTLTFPGLHWGVLVRMDRSAVLAPIQTVLMKLTVAGAFVFLPMLGFLLWATRRLRQEWVQVQEREEWFSTILRSIGDAVIATDDKGFVTFMNPIAQSLTGWNQKDAQGRPLEEVFHIVNEATRESLEGPVTKVFREGTVVGLANHTLLIARDGQERPIDDSGAPIKNTDGTLIGVVLVFRDITDRKQAQDALREREEQLRQSQKMEALGQLAGGVAHDFNNLLVPIMGYSHLLLSRLDSSDPLHGEAEQIKRAADQAASLTQQLLAFSRKQAVQPKVLALNDIVRGIEPMLRRLIREDIELVLTLRETIGTVRADPGQLDQVLLNLVLNARDAMPRGGTLTISTQNVEVDEAYGKRHVMPAGPYVVLAVSDTGHGMDEETRARLFEPFFTTKGQGTGLGLSMVYGIVRQSGGHIAVWSKPGQGSTFKIYLPRLNASADISTPRPVRVQSGRGTETILLVEDEDAVRNFVRQVLQESGYQVLVASHSKDAFLMSGRFEGLIHLMLTDVVMPRMNGHDLAERLRSSRPAMKVLYMSGYTDTALGRYGLDATWVPFLQKPFTPESLLRKVREVLHAPARSNPEDRVAFT